MAKHWSERLECQCGKRFRSYSAEAVHRHNFPALCRKPHPKPGETLIWSRSRDGEHYGKPCYEYTACAGDRKFNIVWAYDRGGSFGFTARNETDYLTDRNGIVWSRTLSRCKAECEKINKRYQNGE